MIKRVSAKDLEAITAISVKGFKSFAEEQRIEIRPLTILAGANSSGKSSALQPLLLLKQTLEAPYDPGPLLLNGSHVHFTSADQVLTIVPGKAETDRFEIEFRLLGGDALRETFLRNPRGGFDLISTTVGGGRGKVILQPDMTSSEVEKAVTTAWPTTISKQEGEEVDWMVVRNRCFLEPVLQVVSWEGTSQFHMGRSDLKFNQPLRSILHVPRLRGLPERAYPTAAIGNFLPGTFEHYVASIILSWQQSGDERLGSLDQSLEKLGLTGRVQANPIDATQVEILVGRLPSKKRGRDGDLINIADVGFGVSQTLPVLVALLAARQEQLVYLEQPELHLHPRAQQALAGVLAAAAMRGVRVVAETHSSLLLMAIQALVAEGKLPPDQVILHWFERDSRGATQVTTGDLDRMGAYGEWPEDFYSVSAAVENRYLNAVEELAFSGKKGAKRKR